MMATVTRHAAERWQERVAPCSFDEAVAAIEAHAPAIAAAARFGARCLKLPNKHRLVLKGERVITVLPRGQFNARDH